MDEEQEKAVQKQFERLQKVKEANSAEERAKIKKELANLLIEKRVSWMEEHLDEMLAKPEYKDLPPQEQAYHIVYIEHMEIDPKDSKIIDVPPNRVEIISRNFCPYLEACQRLELDTRDICKTVGEPSIQEMIKLIHPDLVFGRSYNKFIRPHESFCYEFIELKE
jgi:hypothetical protein